nr:unnamed protein product [Callosobruchus chinensis]
MRFYRQKLLQDVQLKRLGEHQYSCQSVSILDSLLQPYWNWLVSKIPIWLAPNLITILGLIINILTALILIWYSPDAKTETPRWALAFCALGLFIYQSLDAIDGKQARRTGTANPLGELFDHGCDSLSTVFVALSACIAIQIGNYPGWMFFQCFCAMTLFYCAHWQTYVSGTLRFGKVDVTEAQFTIMSILTISAIFGPSIWSTKLFSDSFELWYFIPISTFVCGLLCLYSNLTVIFTGGVGKNGSTVAVAHMTKSEMEYTDSSLLGPTMLFLNQYFNTFINEYYVLWLCLVRSCLYLLNTLSCKASKTLVLGLLQSVQLHLVSLTSM